MKVLINGGLNLSELDGWWAEAYTPEVGWALGDGQEHGEDPARDAVDAEALYDLLECEVIPEFYSRSEDGIPRAWVSRIRNSMAQLTPRFSTNRAVHKYIDQYYLPAATAYLKRVADKAEFGVDIVNWRRALDQKWAGLRVAEVRFETHAEQHIFEAQVYLSDLDPKAVRVELYADGVMESPPMRQAMKYVRQVAGAQGSYVYRGSVSAGRPPTDYTVRVIPHRDGVALPLEDARILWQR